MKKIFLCIVVALIAISCSSDSSSNTASTSSVLVKKMVQTDVDGNLVSTNIYTYNGNKINTITSDDFLYKYFYTGNLIVKEEIYIANNLAFVLDFDYDTQNRLVQYRREAIGPGQIFRYVYQYNNDNTLSVDQYFTYETGSEVEETPAKYYLNAQGEIEKIEEYSGATTLTTTFSYDQKNNPFKNVIGMDKLLIPGGFYSNVTHRVHTGYPPEILDQTFEYTYNADDFPVTGRRTIGTNQVANFQYFYQ